jgi:hypothetical protein
LERPHETLVRNLKEHSSVPDEDVVEICTFRSGTMDFRDGELLVLKWRELQELADFNPDYLHMKKPSSI